MCTNFACVLYCHIKFSVLFNHFCVWVLLELISNSVNNIYYEAVNDFDKL